MLGVDIACLRQVVLRPACAVSSFAPSVAEAEQIAIESAIRLIEREIPLARRGRNGSRREHAKFVAAVFTHSEARPELHEDGVVFSDPQRHHHLCLPSIAERQDGSWGGIDSVAVRSWKKALGAVFRLELAAALQARGFAIEHAEDEWRWSIAGVPARVTSYLSARRATLEEELAGAGLTSTQAPALASAINASERQAKQALSLDELTAQWHQAMRRLDCEPDHIVAASLDAGRQTELDLTGPAEMRKERLDAVPGRLTEFQSTFSRRQLIESCANALVGTRAALEDVISGADDVVARNLVLERAETRDGPIYTTPRRSLAPNALVELVRRNAGLSRGRAWPGGSGSALTDSVSTPSNRRWCAPASGVRLTLVQGGAGTGKSTTLKTIATAWHSAGYRVVGAAVAWRAATTLAADLIIEARAVESWLKAIEVGNQPFSDKTCLIVEEAGLETTAQALRLLEAVDGTGAAGVVVMVGAEHQLRPIGPGHAMRLIRETIGATRIETVVRQREAWARLAPMDIARGKVRVALDAFAKHGQIRAQDGPRATVDAVADRWQQIVDEDPSCSVLVTAKTNAEVRALSAAIRNRLRERGVVTGPDVSIEVADSSGNRHTPRLAAGDRIRFLRRNDELGVVNGTEVRVVSIAQDRIGATRIEVEQDGRRCAFSSADIADDQGRARLAYAYSITLFQSQGSTVD